MHPSVSSDSDKSLREAVVVDNISGVDVVLSKRSDVFEVVVVGVGIELTKELNESVEVEFVQ